jgi:hypothetical protein
MEADPSDFRHIGDPIDFVVFKGATDMKNGVSKDISEILIVDIKTGDSQLSSIQRRIRDAVIRGDVSFVVRNPTKNTTVIYNKDNKDGLKRTDSSSIRSGETADVSITNDESTSDT